MTKTIRMTGGQISRSRLGIGVSLWDGIYRWVVSEIRGDGDNDAAFVVLRRTAA